MAVHPAVPRPIPIVLGDPHEHATVAVVLRVVERGFDDYEITHIIARSPWREHLPRTLDFLVNSMRKEVGLRHGVWICHVVELPDYYWATPLPPHVPPIANIIRFREGYPIDPPRDYRVDVDPSVVHEQW
jgi:hypothetical protein